MDLNEAITVARRVMAGEKLSPMVVSKAYDVLAKYHRHANMMQSIIEAYDRRECKI